MTTDILLAIDYTRQRPDGYAQVLAGAVPTLRAPARQFWQIINDSATCRRTRIPPRKTIRPFERVIDTLTPWRSGNETGGISFNLDKDVGPGTLTVTTAWRNWIWDPSNDRDYLSSKSRRCRKRRQARAVHTGRCAGPAISRTK